MKFKSNAKFSSCALLSLSILLLTGGCGSKNTDKLSGSNILSDTESADISGIPGISGISNEADTFSSEFDSLKNADTSPSNVANFNEQSVISPNATSNGNSTSPSNILNFVDAHGNAYETEINPSVAKHDYDLSCFSRDGNMLSYEGDSNYTYRLGIDVSYHEGNIDWSKVKAAGFEFAIIRIGARGYGKEGRVFLDEKFHTNLQEAKKAGLDVGVYFFSQAINEAEAKEEAEFVLQNLEGCELDLPVVYDPESILDDVARTDNVSGEQFTKNTLVFCELVENAGYEAMIYSNMLWEAYQFDLPRLADYPIWYADYEALPQTPYQFTFWQYTDTALIDAVTEGLDNNYVDLDIQLMKK